MIAQENAPLGGFRTWFGGLQCFLQRPHVARCEGVEEILIGLKIEHHVHAGAVTPEVLHVGVGQHVGLAQDDGIPLAPLQELTHRPQHVVLLDRLDDVRSLGCDHEWDRIHAKARHAELDPKSHDLEDFRLYVRVGRIEIGLKIVEPMEVPFARNRVEGPRRFLHTGEHHALISDR